MLRRGIGVEPWLDTKQCDGCPLAVRLDSGLTDANWRAPHASLSAREIEVLELVAAGRANSEVATTLFVSETTVKSHLAHIFTKLGVTSRTAAISVARQRGILR